MMTQDDGNTDQNDRVCDAGLLFNLGVQGTDGLGWCGRGSGGRKRLGWKRRLEEGWRPGCEGSKSQALSLHSAGYGSLPRS